MSCSQHNLLQALWVMEMVKTEHQAVIQAHSTLWLYLIQGLTAWLGFMDNYELEFIPSAHMLLVKIKSCG